MQLGELSKFHLWIGAEASVTADIEESLGVSLRWLHKKWYASLLIRAHTQPTTLMLHPPVRTNVMVTRTRFRAFPTVPSPSNSSRQLIRAVPIIPPHICSRCQYSSPAKSLHSIGGRAVTDYAYLAGWDQRKRSGFKLA